LNVVRLPKVSALMGAYNYGSYIVEAIKSAMEQEYPPERLELIIVDDGSTDDTAELVAEMMALYPGRIKFVQQQNAGATAATNRARREATGDLIALLDADDVWLPDKTAKQVALLRSRPELGLVFSRMRIIDANGRTLQGQYGHKEPIDHNQFAREIWENVAVQSSLMIEAGLFDQIPAEIPYADWWLALQGTRHKRIEYLREELVLYRWHGANITGGVTGVKALREGQKGIHFQRWVLRNFTIDELIHHLSPEQMQYVWTGLEHEGQKALAGISSYFGQLATVSDQDRSDAQRSVADAERAARDGDLVRACAYYLRARACDPYDQELRARFDEMVASATEAAKLPDPLAGSRAFAIVTDAEYLFEDDERLRSYAEAMRSVPSASLVIDASRLDPSAARQDLSELVGRCGLADDDDVSLVGVLGELAPSQRFRLNSQTRARYGTCQAARSAGTVPTFTEESLPMLRELALGADAVGADADITTRASPG